MKRAKRLILSMLALLRRGTPPTKPQGGYGGMPKPPSKNPPKPVDDEGSK